MNDWRHSVHKYAVLQVDVGSPLNKRCRSMRIEQLLRYDPSDLKTEWKDAVRRLSSVCLSRVRSRKLRKIRAKFHSFTGNRGR